MRHTERQVRHLRIKDFTITIGEIIFPGSRIISYRGLQEIVVEYEMTKNAIGNGTIITGWYMPEREIQIVAKIPRDSVDSTLRYFKANKNLVMVIGKRKIDVVAQSVNVNWSTGFYNNPRITIDLIAPDPYFYSTSDFGENIAKSTPGFGFPWRYSPDEPVNFGYKMFNDQTIFKNDGDDAVGFKLKIQAVGEVSNVKFENLKTGEYIKVIQTLSKDDELEISTVVGDSYIRFNGEDIFDKIDHLSDFFKIKVGDNVLKYSADSGETEMNVYLYYTPKYLSGLEDIVK